MTRLHDISSHRQITTPVKQIYSSQDNIRGFTLAELLVVIAILGISAALAAPSFSDMYADYRLRKAAIDFHNALALAKSEAVKRGAQVSVSASGTNWSDGWNVNLGPSTIIYQFDRVSRITIAKPGGSSIGDISFQSDGIRNDHTQSSPTNSITFKARFCDERDKGREVDVEVSGVTNVNTINDNCGP
ncbi:MAG: GspH/FimT family pseudopilin [Pseudomonadales bacterium]|nr:GspH/FimT family pseudopilin [Pseudomonadales bacterium]